jgi:hypothetical protein
MSDELQHAVSKSFHLSSSSLNGFFTAGTAARLIYHNREGIAACQENLSPGVSLSTKSHEGSQRAVEPPVFLRVSSYFFVGGSGALIALRIRD